MVNAINDDYKRQLISVLNGINRSIIAFRDFIPISARILRRAQKREMRSRRVSARTREKWHNNPLRIYGPTLTQLDICAWNANLEERRARMARMIEDVKSRLREAGKGVKSEL